MNYELKTMWKEAVRPHLRYYPSIFREGLNKTTKNISQDGRYLGQGLDPGPPEYEAGVLTTTKFGYTEAQCFVLYNLFALCMAVKRGLLLRLIALLIICLFNDFCSDFLCYIVPCGRLLVSYEVKIM
jgi:hypothetical protein